jgi:hypothetical protein
LKLDSAALPLGGVLKLGIIPKSINGGGGRMSPLFALSALRKSCECKHGVSCMHNSPQDGSGCAKPENDGGASLNAIASATLVGGV